MGSAVLTAKKPRITSAKVSQIMRPNATNTAPDLSFLENPIFQKPKTGKDSQRRITTKNVPAKTVKNDRTDSSFPKASVFMAGGSKSSSSSSGDNNGRSLRSKKQGRRKSKRGKATASDGEGQNSDEDSEPQNDNPDDDHDDQSDGGSNSEVEELRSVVMSLRKEMSKLQDRNNSKVDFSSLLKTVRQLNGPEDYVDWVRDLRKAANAKNWDKIPDGVSGEWDPTMLDKDRQEAQSQLYILIDKSTKKYESLTKSVPVGDAGAAFKAIRDHFDRKSIPNLVTALRNLMSASMASLKVNANEWHAELNQKHEEFIRKGGIDLGKTVKVILFLEGLAADFDKVREIIYNSVMDPSELTDEYVKQKVDDFADRHNLREKTKWQERNRVYTVTKANSTKRGKPRRVVVKRCRFFLHGRCKNGDKCKS